MGIPIKRKVLLQEDYSFVPLADGEFSKPIQFKKENVIENALIYRPNPLGVLSEGKNFVDISTINDVYGVPTGEPANDGIALNMNDYHKSEWYNVKRYKIVFDLEVLHSLDYAYIYTIQGGSNRTPITMEGSADGVTWNILFPTTGELDSGGWRKIEFLEANKGGNRFFSIGFTWADATLKGLVLYGRPKKAPLNKGIKFSRKVRNTPTHLFMMTNGFYMEDPKMMTQIAGSMRFYVVPEWLMPRHLEHAGDGANLTVDQIQMRLDTANLGSLDQLLQGFKNEGAENLVDLNQSWAFLRPSGTPNPMLTKPVDPGLSHLDLATTTNPLSYKFAARMCYMLAARYGNNVDADASFVNLAPKDDGSPQAMRIGLGLIRCLEIGNEYDRWWEGAAIYFNPQEMAAYLSAIYDGHMGQMGPGFGMKTADPSMLVSMVSTASSSNTGYIREMQLWWNKIRGEGNFAMDVINYHWYNSNDGSQGSGGAFAVHPEIGSLITANKRWVDFRDEFCPQVEVWLTETGYDEHLGGQFSPPDAIQFYRSRHKAYWILRTFMVSQMCGVDVTGQYWYSNHAGTRLEDFNDYEPDPRTFLTSGTTDGIQSADDYNRKPLMTFWYMAGFKKRMTNFMYMHTIVRDGKQMTEEVIFNNPTNNPHLWAMAYKNYVTGEVLITAWLGSGKFETANFTLKVSEELTTIGTLDEAEVRKSIEPVITEVASYEGIINVTLSECPVFITSSNIGTPLPEQPTFIKVQRITQGNLITWTDRNIKAVDVIVSRATSQFGVYTELFRGESKKAQYVDTSANVGTEYFYKVGMMNPGSSGPSDPEDPETPTVGEWINAFDHAYLAAESLNPTGARVSHGEEVNIIADQKGSLNLLYAGRVAPLLSLARPRFFQESDGYIYFPNETGLIYESSEVPRVYPRERWFVGMITNYQIYEAFFNNYNTDYLGDLGSGGVRTKNGASFEGDETWSAPTTIPLNNTFLFRQVFTDDYAGTENLIKVETYLNGVKINKLMTTYKNNSRMLGVGADTNNSHWGLKALMYKEGSILDPGDAVEITQQLMTQFKISQGIPAPYANNVTLDKQGTIYTAAYVYKPYNGITENLSKRIVKWVIMNGVTFGHYIQGADGLLTLNTLDYPDLDFSKGVRVEITVEDVLGNKLNIPQSTAHF